MPRREPLPLEFARRAFSVTESRAAGVTAARLRSSDLTAPYYGVRSPHPDTESMLDRCRALALRMQPGQFFSHVTAGVLWGVPLPASATTDSRLHVSSLAPARPPHTRGVIGHELRQPASGLAIRHGLLVADPALTWIGLASTLALPDLVAAGDYLVLNPAVIDPLDMRPYLTLDDLFARVTSFRGPGKSAAAHALPLIRVGAESRPETLLRLLLTAAGLPEPELNVVLHDASGRFIGRVDMLYRHWKIVVEYDGDQHRSDTGQYEKDMLRRERIAGAGYAAVYIRKYGVFANPASAIERVRARLLEAGWRP